MQITYNAATTTWTVTLEAEEVRVWARYRARLKDARHEPISQREAMRILLGDAWKAARQWTRTATKEALERAYANVDAGTQATAQEAASAALAAAIGFDPEA